MFYLNNDVPVVPGHIILIDSRVGPDRHLTETVLAQRRSFEARRRERCAEFCRSTSRIGLSRDRLTEARWRRPATCRSFTTRSGIKSPTRSRTNSSQPTNVASWFVDPDIQFPNPTSATNLEPLLINTAGSWADRPDAVTRIPNLFLAADFVRTYTDLATMEGANEAARRAVNGILDATKSREKRCRVWKLREPGMLAPLRALDRLRWQLHLPMRLPVRATPSGRLAPVDPIVRGIVQSARFAADHL